MSSISQRVFFLLIISIGFWLGCQNQESRIAATMEQLPARQARYVDSLLQIEQRMRQSGLPADIIAGVWEEIGMSLLDYQPEASLTYFEKTLEDHYQRQSLDAAAELHFLLGRICEDRMRNYECALEHLAGAESIWEKRNDPLQVARARQRKGVVEAKLGRMEEGRRLVESALDQYQRDQFQELIPPARYDLAQVEYLAGNTSLALTYLDELTEEWRRQGAYPQLTQANNLRLRILVEQEQWTEAALVYADNDSLLRMAEAPWRPRLEFLQLSRQLLQHNGPETEAKEVQKAYGALTDSLEAEGLVYFAE